MTRTITQRLMRRGLVAIGLATALAMLAASALIDAWLVVAAVVAGWAVDAWHVVREARAIGAGLTDARQRQDEARLALERLTDFYAALSDTNQALLRTRDAQAFFREMCRICVDTGHASRAWVGLVQGGRLVPVAWSDPQTQAATADMVLTLHPTDGAMRSPAAEAAASGQPCISHDYMTDPRTAPWRHRAATVEVKSSAAFPIHRGDEVLGTFNLYSEHPGFFDAGLVRVLSEMAVDISVGLQQEWARSEAERAALEQNRQLQLVLDTLPAHVVAISRVDDSYLDVNALVCQQFGMEKADIVGKTAVDLGLGLSAKDLAEIRRILAAGGVVANLDTELHIARGQRRSVLTSACEIQEHGRPATLVISIDVTERARAKAALLARERQLSALVDTAMDAIISVDRAQRIVLFNRAASEMFGVPVEEVLGASLDRFIPARFRESHGRWMSHMFDDEASVAHVMGQRRAVLGVRAGGDEFPLEATISRAVDAEGTTITAIIRDMTKFVEAERAERSAAVSDAANKAKTAFISRMSHELRTPLTAMLGFAELLHESSHDHLDARQSYQLAQVREAGSQLRSLIDDLLDLAQVEAGKMPLHGETTDVGALVARALVLCEPQAHAYGVSLHNLAEPRRDYVFADPLRLRQIVINLLSNGIKYNHRGGGVTVRLRSTAHEVGLQIVDDGQGMSSEQLALLFQPFNRLGRENGPIEGTGLGMALVRELANLLGARIDVESAPNHGTTVTLTLPRSQPPVDLAVAAHAADTGPLPLPADAARASVVGTVLYVEDNPVNSIIVQSLLERLRGVNVVIAVDGAEGLRLARTLLPDLVLLDYGLPDMTGIDVLNRLRADEQTASLVTVMLSASALPEHRDAARAAGALEYWTKPMDFEQLRDGVTRLLRRSAAGRGARTPPAAD